MSDDPVEIMNRLSSGRLPADSDFDFHVHCLAKAAKEIVALRARVAELEKADEVRRATERTAWCVVARGFDPVEDGMFYSERERSAGEMSVMETGSHVLVHRLAVRVVPEGGECREAAGED